MANRLGDADIQENNSPYVKSGALNRAAFCTLRVKQSVRSFADACAILRQRLVYLFCQSFKTKRKEKKNSWPIRTY